MLGSNITIIGAGVMGLSIAFKLCPDYDNIIVVERNYSFGMETSSRNSEVIHAGLYYLPDSLKAKTCTRGKELLYELCRRHNISHKRLGKLVVANDNRDLKKIKDIYNNGLACGVSDLRLLSEKEISQWEPDVKAKAALYSPSSGIIDSHGLMDFFFKLAKEKGVMFSFSTEVIAIKRQSSQYKVTVKEPDGETFSFTTNTVINCAGLDSDKVAAMAGIDRYQLYYCRGQYFRIKSPKKFSINHLIYPPATKISLGIHITPDLGEGLRLGPDAAYIPEIDYQLNEADSAHFHQSVKKFLPNLAFDDLIPDTVGIRPKLQAEDEEFHDFVIGEEEGFSRFINLIGIESPGLTSSLAIAEIVGGLIKD